MDDGCDRWRWWLQPLFFSQLSSARLGGRGFTTLVTHSPLDDECSRIAGLVILARRLSPPLGASISRGQPELQQPAGLGTFACACGSHPRCCSRARMRHICGIAMRIAVATGLSESAPSGRPGRLPIRFRFWCWVEFRRPFWMLHLCALAGVHLLMCVVLGAGCVVHLALGCVRLTLDFDTNKKIAEEVAIIPSKRLRNQIAGFVTHLMKRIQRGGSVRGISLKLQVRNQRRWQGSAGRVQGSQGSALCDRRPLFLLVDRIPDRVSLLPVLGPFCSLTAGGGARAPP